MDLLEMHDGQRHPWEDSRAAFFLDIAGRALADRPGRVLDVGAGDAYFAGALANRSGATITCWDASYTDAIVDRLAARSPGLAFTREPPDGPFDLALMLDVVEHVEDDVAFVRSVVARLAPGAHAVVSVPAWPALFGAHDELLLHHRRYTPTGCDRVLAAAGLHVLARGGLFHSLLAPRAAAIAVEKVRRALGRDVVTTSAAAAWDKGALVTGAVRGALRLDNALSRSAARLGVALPGLSYWALARKA